MRKMDLYVLTKQAKSNNSSLLKIINLFTPKINKSLSQTDFQNREDLSQEIKLQLIKDIRNYDADGVPGFFQMFESLKKQMT